MEIARGDIETKWTDVFENSRCIVELIRATVTEPISFLHALKFERVGRHPLLDQEMNFIEQVNQTFTALVTLRAAELLFDWHVGLERIRVNIGSEPGSDLESVDGTFAAEVFTAVKPTNNDKLRDDVARVLRRTDVLNRYVFFYSPGIPQGPYRNYFTTHGVQVWSVSFDR